MRPCLLLALALLGTASARHLAAGPSEVAKPEELELEPESELEAEAEAEECPLEAETEALNITEPQSARTFRYIIVRRCQNFHTAQRVCSRCYRGRLASIHSYRTNVLLQCRARARVNNGRVWIGAITRPVGRSVFCYWSDRSGWNYAYWLHGYPLLTGRFCTTLCTA
uniref:C-type lectin domain-containing protein n=2 Tax=Anas platyrhynchos TaxID=8839 RepID=A0A8B9TIA5_ANAPL